MEFTDERYRFEPDEYKGKRLIWIKFENDKNLFPIYATTPKHGGRYPTNRGTSPITGIIVNCSVCSPLLPVKKF
jgi:hypothetical protein